MVQHEEGNLLIALWSAVGVVGNLMPLCLELQPFATQLGWCHPILEVWAWSVM
jgi:hypothetical protein